MSANNQKPGFNQEAAAQAEKQVAAKLAQRPIEDQIAFNKISKNILNGCSWEFIRGGTDLKRHIKNFQQNPNMQVCEVSYNKGTNQSGYLLYVKFEYLMKIINDVMPGIVDQHDVQSAMKHRQESIMKLAKKMKAGFHGVIGIYCTNDYGNITVSGKTYDAYAITYQELMQVCAKTGYGVKLKDRVLSPNEAMQHAEKIIKELIVAPSGNALFITVEPLANKGYRGGKV